jgi:hypothetical protein
LLAESHGAFYLFTRENPRYSILIASQLIEFLNSEIH